MSDLEKARAATLLSIIAIVLAVLSAVRGDAGFGPVRESIEVCAASKGALCDDATAVPHFAHGARAAVRLASLDSQPADGSNPALVRGTPAYLGSMTISATPLPLSRLAELEASRASARYLGRLVKSQAGTASVTEAASAGSGSPGSASPIVAF